MTMKQCYCESLYACSCSGSPPPAPPYPSPPPPQHTPSVSPLDSYKSGLSPPLNLIRLIAQAAEASHTQGVGTVVQPVMSHDPPPTYYHVDKFTSVFQSIVDAYGVARYREVGGQGGGGGW